jgi:hypothetical protein
MEEGKGLLIPRGMLGECRRREEERGMDKVEEARSEGTHLVGVRVEKADQAPELCGGQRCEVVE